MALYLRNIRQPFPVWRVGGEVARNHVSCLLCGGTRFRQTAGPPQRSLGQIALFHSLPHLASADGDSKLFKCKLDPVHTIVPVAWILRIYLPDFNQKLLPRLRDTAAPDTAITPRLADFENMAHRLDVVLPSAHRDWTSIKKYSPKHKGCSKMKSERERLDMGKVYSANEHNETIRLAEEIGNRAAAERLGN